MPPRLRQPPALPAVLLGVYVLPPAGWAQLLRAQVVCGELYTEPPPYSVYLHFRFKPLMTTDDGLLAN
eukprot:1177243-Prorocentrum_minimum.AAC.1